MTRLLSIMLSAGLGLSSVFVSGCDADEAPTADCSLDAVPSMVILVVDENDQLVSLPLGTVTYTLGGGETRVVEAEFDTVDNPVTIYGGAGLHGVFVAPPGYEAGELSADVDATADGCHAVTEEVELVLEAVEA